MMTKKEIDDAGKAEYAKWRADKDKSNFLKAQNMVAQHGETWGPGIGFYDQSEQYKKDKEILDNMTQEELDELTTHQAMQKALRKKQKEINDEVRKATKPIKFNSL